MPSEYFMPNTPKATKSGDIFRLGVVLFQMLTGRKPFEGDTAKEIITNVCDPDVLPSISQRDAYPYCPELRKLCLAMLDKNPLRRPTAKQLRNYYCGTSITASITAPLAGKYRAQIQESEDKCIVLTLVSRS
eukprot:GILJ01046757.1.p1 GENE.GILJ01046757.1~~GILJ01046757.1.p1  ORF type:complete len:132 (+),score=13.47 GILJ01046757.1:116-511(+)